MKSILATLALVLGTQAHAVVIPDMIYTTVRCETAMDIPDLGLSLEVRTGGLAGLTQVVIHEAYFMGPQFSHTRSIYVREKISTAIGAPIVYEGNGLTLSINFTTALDHKNGHPGSVHAVFANDEVIDFDLSCQSIMHAM